jgi:hypothetical protein
MKNCNKCNEVKSYEFFSKHKSYKDGYQTTCKSCINKNTKLYYLKNKEKIKEYSKKYQKKSIKKKEYTKKYYLKNKEYHNEYSKKHQKENKEYYNEYYKNRRKNDSTFKFKCNVRCLISYSFKRGINQFRKNAKTEDILGCTIEEFRDYISLKFTKGMSFDNHGKWHLDHIIPLASAETEEDILRLNHYTNFQPLWAADNISKGAKIV